MKAKELMCDDLVLHHGNTYKVFGVMRNADGVDLIPIHLRNAEELLLGPITCFATEIEPIPLTAEILEKNGFKQVEDGIQEYDFPDGIWQNDNLLCGLDYNHNGMFYTFSNNPEDDGLINQICGTFYVHTLQHCLRLCGLDELADNFEV